MRLAAIVPLVRTVLLWLAAVSALVVAGLVILAVAVLYAVLLAWSRPRPYYPPCSDEGVTWA